MFSRELSKLMSMYILLPVGKGGKKFLKNRLGITYAPNLCQNISKCPVLVVPFT